MSKTAKIAWIAGIIEGEGWIGYDAKRGRFRLTIEMIDEDVISRAADLIGVNSYASRKREGRRRTYQINASGQKAVRMVVLIYPYLGQRRRTQANKTLLAYRLRKNQKLLDKALKIA